MSMEVTKVIAFGGSLATGVVSGAASDAAGSIGQFSTGAVILAVSSSILAVVGLVLTFMDKRKIAAADTSNVIIAAHEKTIAFLESQLDKAQEDVKEARDRGHKINDEMQALLLLKETHLSTLRAMLVENGIALPKFSHDPSISPVFQKKDA